MSGWKRWFWLSVEECLVVGGLLAIALVGLTARHAYLSAQESRPVEPPAPQGVEAQR